MFNTNFTVKELWQNLKNCYSTLSNVFTQKFNNCNLLSDLLEIDFNKRDDNKSQCFNLSHLKMTLERWKREFLSLFFNKKSV